MGTLKLGLHSNNAEVDLIFHHASMLVLEDDIKIFSVLKIYVCWTKTVQETVSVSL